MDIKNYEIDNRLLNLIKFNANFSTYIDNNSLLKHSPDYILEKYNHWIGFNPTINGPLYTPDKISDFMLNYANRWGDSYKIAKRQLFYLKLTENFTILKMVNTFEKYIGSILDISNREKRGLHHNVESSFIPTILALNEEDIKIVSRDMKISSII